MRKLTQTVPIELAESPNTKPIKTTLYDLIEAIGESVDEGEEKLIAKTVLHMFQTRKIKLVGDNGNQNYRLT
jgi:hypothetical protein